jgi:uncharacterized protein (DUF2062 family)
MKKLIQRYVPGKKVFDETSNLGPLHKFTHDPYIWHLNRRSVSGGVAVGLFCAYLPMPMETLVAAALAIILRVNLPISVALVWISNPLTWIPMYGAGYMVGAHLLNIPPVSYEDMTIAWLLDQALPLWLGSIILGALLSAVGYIITRILWRWLSIRSWKRRRARLKGDRP